MGVTAPCSGIKDLVNLSYNQLLLRRVKFKDRSPEDLYARLMCAYYQNEPLKLIVVEDIIKSATPFENKELLLKLCIFRKKMLNICVTIEDANELIEAGINSSWSGDIYFCAALGMYKISEYVLAKDLFIKSYGLLNDQGASRKGLLAKQNAITMEGNIQPENRLIGDYQDLIKEAKQIDASDVVANACLNISDEFYKIGAYDVALSVINEGLKALVGHSLTHQEKEALLLKAEILSALDRKKEAKELLNLLCHDSNEEIVNALKVIEKRHYGKNSAIDVNKLSPPWRVKLEGYKDIQKLGRLEEAVVELLSTTPSTIYEIAGHLYENVDEGDAANRASTLISRINKKQPTLIKFESELKTYCLSDNEKIEFQKGER